jgi:hypothetical protein
MSWFFVIVAGTNIQLDSSLQTIFLKTLKTIKGRQQNRFALLPIAGRQVD